MKKTVWLMITLAFTITPLFASEIGEEGYAQSGEVKIHYVTMGKGPLVVMIHGFPDFWYTWREQMPSLAENFKVVAIDQRGYNKSGQPKGVANYAMPLLVEDIRAVIEHFSRDRAVIIGHDWGGAVAWAFAMQYPQKTERLIILNLPHPNGLRRELANNPEQQRNSQYARDFQKPDAAKNISAEQLASWVKDAQARKKYIEAFRRSSFEGMLNYYKANYPSQDSSEPIADLPDIQCSVLMFHGLQDKALLPAELNNTWEWIASDLTLITIPGAGHFVQQDASEFITKKMVKWLQP